MTGTDLLADAARVLQGYRPLGAEQQGLRQELLRHVAEHPDGWSRTCRPDHLTASALIVEPRSGRVLLMAHRKVGRWLQTGGHCEAADTGLAAAALREATEESGLPNLVVGPLLRLSRHGAPCAADARHHLDVQFLVRASTTPGADGPGTPPGSAESHAVRWFEPDGLPADTDEELRLLVAAATAAPPG